MTCYSDSTGFYPKTGTGTSKIRSQSPFWDMTCYSDSLARQSGNHTILVPKFLFGNATYTRFHETEFRRSAFPNGVWERGYGRWFPNGVWKRGYGRWFPEGQSSAR